MGPTAKGLIMAFQSVGVPAVRLQGGYAGGGAQSSIGVPPCTINGGLQELGEHQ